MAIISFLFLLPGTQVEAEAVWCEVDGINGGKILFDYEYGYIAGAEDTITAAIIPETIDGVKVKGINKSAFEDKDQLVRLEIREGLVSIGSRAFYDCDSLEIVKMEDSVKAVGSASFYSCDVLRQVELSDNIQTLATETFAYCKELESVNLPSQLTDIMGSVFYECEKLAGNIVIPENVWFISGSAFYNCSSITGLEMQSKVIGLGPFAFYGCTSLATIEFRRGVENIERYSFYGCPMLMNVLYHGTEEHWDAMNIAEGNENLKNANRSYLTFVEFVGEPLKTEYIWGEDLDLTGLEVYEVYADGTRKEITDYTVDGYNKELDGEQTITVTYKGYTKTLKIKVVRILTGIEIASEPTKTEYIWGEELDLTGLKVNEIYSGGVKREAHEYTVTGYDKDLVGEQTIIVFYKEYVQTFQVKVSRVLTGIRIDRFPDKMEHIWGEDLDLTGLVVNEVYNDATEVAVIDYIVNGGILRCLQRLVCNLCAVRI